MHLLVAACLAALARADGPAPADPHQLPAAHTAGEHGRYAHYAIVSQEHMQPGDGSYQSSFQTENGIYRAENGSPRPGYGAGEHGQPAGGYVHQGSWSYTDDYGQPVKVDFVADENGYRPNSDILPTPVPTQYPLPVVPQVYQGEGAYGPAASSHKAPAPASYNKAATATYSDPGAAIYSSPAVATYSSPAVATYSGPAPATYSGPLVAACLAALARAEGPAPADPHQLPAAHTAGEHGRYAHYAIVSQEHVQPGDGSYQSSFQTENGIYRAENGNPRPGYGAGEHGQPTGGYVHQGSWSYTDDYGQPVKVDFVADENGYRPNSDTLPTPVPTQYPLPVVPQVYQGEGAYGPAASSHKAPAPASYSKAATATYRGPAAATYSSPAVATYRGPAPATYSSPAAATYSSPAFATYSAPVLISYSGPAPASHSGPAPTSYSGPAPASYRSQAPVSYTPAGYSGPAHASYSGPAPASYSGPAHTQHIGSVQTQHLGFHQLQQHSSGQLQHPNSGQLQHHSFRCTQHTGSGQALQHHGSHLLPRPIN
ncbi:skin secretory protein xP2-like [Pollicipes pollicipes]|uniref:skin secretory protein xP2-like n=1 Tax=Pollicipes pollicipes TaxID=41117 RepID=UPI001884F352|nr:skin secretory protein xP2-like [Pollicipes pollicipes]